MKLIFLFFIMVFNMSLIPFGFAELTVESLPEFGNKTIHMENSDVPDLFYLAFAGVPVYSERIYVVKQTDQGKDTWNVSPHLAAGFRFYKTPKNHLHSGTIHSLYELYLASNKEPMKFIAVKQGPQNLKAKFLAQEYPAVDIKKLKSDIDQVCGGNIQLPQGPANNDRLKRHYGALRGIISICIQDEDYRGELKKISAVKFSDGKGKEHFFEIKDTVLSIYLPNSLYNSQDVLIQWFKNNL